ncbi:MAG: hypothetical protein K2J76_03640, partial [Oscillospiraceae bacterium]|nr:hypothetical protein [Oscillospiraceae bacterium]
SGRVRSPSKWLSPFLTPFSVFFEKGSFALCGGRQGVLPLDPTRALPLDPASWAQLDQLMTVFHY